MKTRGGRRKRGATLLGERRAARSQARAEAAPAAERRERGAERRGLPARRNVNQIPEPRESPPICSDLTWLLAAAAAAAPEQINRRTRSAAQRSAEGSAAAAGPSPRCAPEPAGGAELGGPGGPGPLSVSAPRATMSFPQLGYQYIRPLYPPERPGAAAGGGSAGARGGPGAGASELAASGSLSNVLSSVYGAPYAAAAAAAAAAQGYGAFLPYAAELPIFPQLVSALGAAEGRLELGRRTRCARSE